MAVSMLERKVREAEKLSGEPFPAETLLRLKHMIVSHHGEYEYGSPKLPMTIEAVALFCLDNLDAKIHTFQQQLRDDPNVGSRWTHFNPNLGRKLFKGGDGTGERIDRMKVRTDDSRRVHGSVLLRKRSRPPLCGICRRTQPLNDARCRPTEPDALAGRAILADWSWRGPTTDRSSRGASPGGCACRRQTRKSSGRSSGWSRGRLQYEANHLVRAARRRGQERLEPRRLRRAFAAPQARLRLRPPRQRRRPSGPARPAASPTSIIAAGDSRRRRQRRHGGGAGHCKRPRRPGPARRVVEIVERETHSSWARISKRPARPTCRSTARRSRSRSTWAIRGPRRPAGRQSGLRDGPLPLARSATARG